MADLFVSRNVREDPTALLALAASGVPPASTPREPRTHRAG